MTTIDIQESVVATAAGRVRGTVEDGVHVFRGIPYAEPPVGRLRFRPPQRRAPWDGVRDATRFGEIPMQRPDPVEGRLMRADSRPPMGPDCLSLNVWTPDPGATGLPVLVWIHGGSLKHGTGADVLYDGRAFTADGIVVVTINYRLTAAGFLYLPDRPGAGAFGLLDQVAALAWVRDNIAAFGGDPDRVTVAGESAGAHSIGQLLGMPAARGLFRRAVLQSGAGYYDTPVEASAVFGAALLEHLGVRRGDDDAISEITDRALLDAYFAVEPGLLGLLAGNGVTPNLTTAATGVACLSTYGGDVVPRRAVDAVAGGSAAGVDLLIGTNADEAALYPAEFIAYAPMAAQAAFASTGCTVDEVFAAYAATGEQAVPTRFLTDAMFRIPAERLLDAAGAHGGNVYGYLLTWASPPDGDHAGACHGMDLPLVFRAHGDLIGSFIELAGRTPSPALIDAVHGAWASFVIHGVPAHPSLPAWPVHGPDRAVMVLDETSRVVADPAASSRAIWEGVSF